MPEIHRTSAKLLNRLLPGRWTFELKYSNKGKSIHDHNTDQSTYRRKCRLGYPSPAIPVLEHSPFAQSSILSVSQARLNTGKAILSLAIPSQSVTAALLIQSMNRWL
jgi:hypothetical protein